MQTQKSNEATDGLSPSVLDSFSGAARAASYEFPPASEEDPSRETPGSDSQFCSRGLVLSQGDTTGPKSRGLAFPEGTLQTHKCPTRLPTGWHRRFWIFFGQR